MTFDPFPKNLAFPDSLVVRIADFDGYQAGSIHSRSIIGTAGGSVTLLAFDETEALNGYAAPFDALACVCKAKPRSQFPASPKDHDVARQPSCASTSSMP